MNKSRINKLINIFAKKNILVIGDVILDQYIEGSVTRISPEAPVPIVLEKGSFYTPGGAANVAHNLRSLGSKVTLLGKVGKDPEGQILKKQLEEKQVDIKGIFTSARIPTITKTRILAQHQQVLRVDRECLDKNIVDDVSPKIDSFIKRRFKEYDAIIISDYGKGIVTKARVQLLSELAQKNDTILTIDPKVENFGYYRGVTAITPNLKEAENAIRDIKIKHSDDGILNVRSDRLDSVETINQAGKELLNFLDLECLLMTLSEKGMCLFEKNSKPYHIPTKAKEVFDVTGAGDAVISVFTLALSAGSSKREAAELANLAAGIVVGHMGAVAVSKKELKESLSGKDS